MSESQFSWPGHGASDHARELIAAFLVLDIQHSPDWAQDLRAKIAAVKVGALPSWERLGNAYRLSVSAEGALIEDLIDPTKPPQRVPLEELEAAVAAWIEAIG